MKERSQPEEEPVLLFETPAQWNAWLRKNHAKATGLWMRLAKKNSGLRSITYFEAVEVALCHGWIDAKKMRYDELSSIQRFTARKPRSGWSKINKEKAQALIDAGLMTPAGLAAVEQAKANGQWERAYDGASTITVPPDLQAALNRNKKAKAFFATLKGSNRYAILHRTQTAKT
ncbi:MAG TPA: YdeI/OmpD-associated family protein, partial [Flavobacteriales bacterium]|nr:YdeI/OmpD-associated family protein [Flavobacteriales bacterium]